jgi:hypothetical protein
VGSVVDLVVDPVGREKIRLELPPVFRLPPEEARGALGLPDFVDTSDPIVARAVSLLAAARSAEGPALPLSLLGGAAYRLGCPSSNDPSLGLRRPLHDLDIACLHRDIRRVRELFRRLPEVAGSALAVFETPADRMFNALQGGRRLRFHNVQAFDGRQVQLGVVDLLADEFRFCHNLDLREDVGRAPELGYTLSSELLLLTKLQYIQSVPASHAGALADRVLRPFGRDHVVIGPEDKDVRDVLAVLVDRPIGENATDISPRRFARRLERDWGLWTTVTLNLEMVERAPALRRLPVGVQDLARERLSALRSAAAALSPKRRFGWFRTEWWEPVESPPAADVLASVGSGPAGVSPS